MTDFELKPTEIKVLHLIDSGGLYGAEKMLLSLCSEQLEQGLKPTILSCGASNEPEKTIEREAARLNIDCVAWRMKPGLNVRGALSIRDFAVRNEFDVFHSHGYKFNILFGLMPKSVRAISLISTIHGYVLPKRFSKMWFNLLLDRLALTRLDGVVFVNEAMLEQEFFKDLRLDNSATIENGIKLSLFENVNDQTPGDRFIQSMRDHNSGSLVIGYIGRLSQEKGAAFLLDAFAQLCKQRDDVRLLFCGDGPLRSVLEEQANLLGLSNVVNFVGFINNVPKALQEINVFVVPSLTEGMPMVLMEAMASGKCIVATDVGAMPEMLSGYQQSAIVRPSDSTALLEEISALLTPNSQQHVSTNSPEATEVFSSSKMAEKYLMAYQRFARGLHDT